MQTNLFDLHCRGATGYVAKPNIAEAESIPGSATGYVAKPNIAEAESIPGSATGYVAKPNIAEAESLSKGAPQDISFVFSKNWSRTL